MRGMAAPTVSLASAFATILLISMAFLPPFAESSRLSGISGGQMMGNSQGDREEKKKSASVFHPLFNRCKTKSSAIPFSSQREVPAGPDPIHHRTFSPFRPLP